MNVGHLVHLTTRFLRSLHPGPPSAADDRWAREHLGPGESALWDRMSNPDRRHAVAVARAVVAELGQGTERPVVAAALLHDTGKVVSDLGTFSRVAATLLWAVVDDRRAGPWASSDRALVRRIGQYRCHPRLGAELLREAGADPLTSAWAADHHRPTGQWTVPADIGRVLKACDDD